MNSINTELLLIIGCCVIFLSYLFSIISKYIRVPSVLLLLFAGMGARQIVDTYGINLPVPERFVEALGTVGLIMIVLEAGLDLKVRKSKFKLIGNSFFSALFIFVLSAVLISFILYYWLHQPVLNCIAYAIPLSIISSAIVIPSIHVLSERKKEFLIYETSFSDIVGIVAFNYFTAKEILTLKSLAFFGGSIILSLILSVLCSVLLLFIMAKTQLNVRFFLIFSLLIFLYAYGKLIHLPSLIIILLFGLMINNWELINKLRLVFLNRYLPMSEVQLLRHALHSITAESSFLVRTFFFILFGFSIDLKLLWQNEVIMVGSMIVVALFLVRVLYLHFVLRTNLFPEVFFLPRGLITIVLFYKIPVAMKLPNFNNGILFFVILTTSIIMTIGMISYRKKPDDLVTEGAFSEPGDSL
jgi:Kef-type K+ transport system membrane component KefB